MTNQMNTANCVCDKCGAKAHSIPGSAHRRCSGNPENSKPVEKHCNIPAAHRGEWQSEKASV